MTIDEDHIQHNYECVTCGKYLIIKGGIIPRSPLWYCTQCGNEGKLGEQFKVSD